MSTTSPRAEVGTIVEELRGLANPAAVEGMARYGINPRDTLGISIPSLRQIAKRIGQDHGLALQLWETGLHEARMLACFVDAPGLVTESQMERWAADFDSWDVCDQCCGNLFRKTSMAVAKAFEWSERTEEFVKRAGFVLMAQLAVHDKRSTDAMFLSFLPLIEAEATDDRNFVKKAANWALRQVGKRNASLNRESVQQAQRLIQSPSLSARWIGADALRELTGDAAQAKLFR
jgi:3-methyladenine DNA glycosylase AlkD